MTELNKPVRRKTRLPFAHYRRRIVVTLEPGDTIAMRLERTRTTWAPLSVVFHQFAEWHTLAQHWQKQAERKWRKSLWNPPPQSTAARRDCNSQADGSNSLPTRSWLMPS